MRQQRMEVLKKFDQDKDGILNAEERAEARKYVKENQPAAVSADRADLPAADLVDPAGGPGFGPPGGGPGGPGSVRPVRRSGIRRSGFRRPGFRRSGCERVRQDRPRVIWISACRLMVILAPGSVRRETTWASGPGSMSGFGPPGADDRGPGGPGGPGATGVVAVVRLGAGPAVADRSGGHDSEPATPGKQLAPADVTSYPGKDLYDPEIIRTIFLQFENQDWEEELEDFRSTDVDVPAQMIVDGETYENVGVRFRGNTSYMMVPRGSKRSLNLTVDYGKKDQRLGGRTTLNLLNAHTDPSFLRNVLFNRISRQYLPTADANVVRVVINGENWGIYTNEEQVNKDFLQKWFGDAKGARWKIPPNFSGASGLMFLGDDLQPYKQNYEIKTKDNDE